ncbi:MAG: glycosyltransferase family 4 protein [Cyanobacteria bacterium P01_F01_bin.150]
MNIAYFVNQYPKVSHSFIRREIQGLESQGFSVQRFALRSCEEELVDPDDQTELEQTKLILGVGLLGLFWHMLWVAIARPLKFWKTFSTTWTLGLSSDRGLPLYIISLAEACVLLRWLNQGKVDHLHVHFGTNSTTVALLCCQLGGPPYSFTVHGPEEFDRVKGIELTEKINQAKFVIAISSFGRSQLYRWCDYTQWPKIHIVRCGVDDKFLQQGNTPIMDTPTLVCVGRLCEQKGQLLLLEATHRLIQEGTPLNLILVGDGDLRPEVETRIDDYGLAKHVTITGWSSGSEVQKYLNQSRALVLPSFAEGLPVVIMEALALGRPVISTYVAGIPELVTSGVCGWLVTAGSVDDLVMAMREALTQPVEALQEMGHVGSQRVQDRHNAQTESKVLAQLFKT